MSTEELKQSCKTQFKLIADRFWNIYSPDQQLRENCFERMSTDKLDSLTDEDKAEIADFALAYVAERRQFFRQFKL